MKGLWKYFKGYKKEAAAAPFMKLFEALLELLIPLFVARIIDVGIKENDTGTVWRMVGLMVLCGTVGMLFSITSQYFSAKAAVGFSCAVRRDLYRHVLRLPRSESDVAGGSALLTRLTADVDRLQNGVNLGLRLLLRSPFIVLGSVVFAYIKGAELGWIFLAAVPALAVVIFVIILWGIPLFKKVQAKLDELTRHTRDNLRGVRVIRAFRHENEEIESFDEVNNEHTRRTLFAGRISSLLNPLTYVIVNLAVILLVKYGAPAVNEGKLAQGDVIALYNYMSQILIELVKLANLVVTLTKATACADRISATLALPLEDDSDKAEYVKERENAPAVEFRSAGFRYGGASGDSLEPVSFTLGHGETVGILGGTGSGKTTLVSLIPRFYDATSGEVFVDGVNVKDYPVTSLRSKIACVAQHAQLFAGTVAENIRWGKPDADDEEVRAALEAAGALDFVESKDGGINCAVEQGGRNFSGGQRQRLTIARALVRQPEILILDDSFSALDYATDLKVRTNVASLACRPATIIISQRPSSVMSADKIIVLDDGKAVGIGTHDELMNNCGVYREIYESQYGGQDNGK